MEEEDFENEPKSPTIDEDESQINKRTRECYYSSSCSSSTTYVFYKCLKRGGLIELNYCLQQRYYFLGTTPLWYLSGGPQISLTSETRTHHNGSDATTNRNEHNDQASTIVYNARGRRVSSKSNEGDTRTNTNKRGVVTETMEQAANNENVRNVSNMRELESMQILTTRPQYQLMEAT